MKVKQIIVPNVKKGEVLDIEEEESDDEDDTGLIKVDENVKQTQKQKEKVVKLETKINSSRKPDRVKLSSKDDQYMVIKVEKNGVLSH